MVQLLALRLTCDGLSLVRAAIRRHHWVVHGLQGERALQIIQQGRVHGYCGWAGCDRAAAGWGTRAGWAFLHSRGRHWLRTFGQGRWRSLSAGAGGWQAAQLCGQVTHTQLLQQCIQLSCFAAACSSSCRCSGPVLSSAAASLQAAAMAATGAAGCCCCSAAGAWERPAAAFFLLLALLPCCAGWPLPPAPLPLPLAGTGVTFSASSPSSSLPAAGAPAPGTSHSASSACCSSGTTAGAAATWLDSPLPGSAAAWLASSAAGGATVWPRLLPPLAGAGAAALLPLWTAGAAAVAAQPPPLPRAALPLPQLRAPPLAVCGSGLTWTAP